MKITKPQEETLEILKNPHSRIKGDFITRKWAITWKSGGFMPSRAIRESIVRGLLAAKLIRLVKTERGVFIYKKSPKLKRRDS